MPKALSRVAEEGVPDWLQPFGRRRAALEGMSRDDQFGPERDARQVFDRLAGCWTYWGWKYGYFDSEKRCAHLSRRDVRDARAPNRRSELTAVVQHRLALGVRNLRTGARALVRRPGDGASSPLFRHIQHPQVSACFILGIEDDLINEGGIFDGVIREARIFKGGSGSGANFSKIRAAGEKLTGGGTSSGLMSFLKVFDRAAGAIKSGGTTRRAAKMVVLNADHPTSKIS